jgi:hypothetical protein
MDTRRLICWILVILGWILSIVVIPVGMISAAIVFVFTKLVEIHMELREGLRG